MTDSTRRRLSRGPLALAAVVMATMLAACSGATADQSGPESVPTPGPVSSADLAGVTLKVGDQKAGVEPLLKASGEDKDLPYAVEWSTFTAGPPLLEAAASGAVDIGHVGNTPPIFAGVVGAPISIVSATRTDGRGEAILVAKDSPIRTVADLKGRTVAVTKGSSAHGHLLLALRKAGIEASEVKISYVSPSDGYAALKNGGVDAWTVWDPYTAAAQQEIGARILEDGSGVTNGLSFEVARNAALADPGKNAAIADFVLRVQRAHQWAAAHPDEWATVYAQETGLPLEVAKVYATRTVRTPVELDAGLISSEQTLVDTLADNGFIPKKFDFSTLVDERFNPAVAELITKA